MGRRKLGPCADITDCLSCSLARAMQSPDTPTCPRHRIKDCSFCLSYVTTSSLIDLFHRVGNYPDPIILNPVLCYTHTHARATASDIPIKDLLKQRSRTSITSYHWRFCLLTTLTETIPLIRYQNHDSPVSNQSPIDNGIGI